MKKQERLRIIRELVKTKKISSQEDLIGELKKRGFSVTQATVSRDITALNLVKVRDTDQRDYYSLNARYLGDPQAGYQRMRSKFRESVISIEVSNNIIVVKTNPGDAQGVAASIDGSNYAGILGTVAGDDTIICVVDSNDNAKKILEVFKSL